MKHKARQRKLDMKKRFRSQRKSHASPGYNLQMIHDFLEHLLWEHRIFNFEYRTGNKVTNPELVESYQKFYRRYGVALLPLNYIRNDVHDPKLWAEADSKYRTQLMEASQSAIDAIEAAMPYITTAIGFVEATKGDNAMLTAVRRASQVLGIDPPVKSKLPEPLSQMPLHYLEEAAHPNLLEAFKKADLVFAVDEKTGRIITLFGDDRIKNIIETRQAEKLGMLGFVIDAETSELESLLVLTEKLKGSHCYPTS